MAVIDKIIEIPIKKILKSDRYEKLRDAIMYGDLEVVRQQIKLGTHNIDIGYKPHKTHLSLAATYKSLDIVKELIEAGCDINTPGTSSNTPLMQAIGGMNGEILDYLIECGADPFIINEQGLTALDLGIEHLDNWLTKYDLDIVFKYRLCPFSELLCNIVTLNKYMKSKDKNT